MKINSYPFNNFINLKNKSIILGKEIIIIIVFNKDWNKKNLKILNFKNLTFFKMKKFHKKNKNY